MTPLELGEQFETRRRILGLSQVTLSDLAGVSPRTIYAIEQGKATARLDSILAVSDALGLEFELKVRGQ